MFLTALSACVSSEILFVFMRRQRQLGEATLSSRVTKLQLIGHYIHILPEQDKLFHLAKDLYGMTSKRICCFLSFSGYLHIRRAQMHDNFSE